MFVWKQGGLQRVDVMKTIHMIGPPSLKLRRASFAGLPAVAGRQAGEGWWLGAESGGKCPVYGQNLQCLPNYFNILFHYSA